MNGPATAELQAAAVKGSLWTGLNATLALPLSLLANIVVARALGPIQFGYLATLMAAYGIAVTVINAGVSDATVQWGAASFARGGRPELVQLVRRCSGYHLLVEMPLIVAVTAVLMRGAPRAALVAACAAAAITVVVGTASVVQTLLSRTAKLARVTLAANIALQVSVATTAVASGSGPSTWAVRLAAGILVPGVLLFLLPADLFSAVLRPLPPVRWPKNFVWFAFKAAAVSLVSMLVFSRTEIFVLQAQGASAAAGLYALAFGVAAQLTAPIDSMLGPLVPAAASLAASAPARLRAALLRGLRFSGVAAGSLAALVIPASSALIEPVYGHRFALAGELLLPLALISCIQSLNHPVTAFAYGLRKLGPLFVINSAAFALDILVAMATVNSLHAWGAVAANAVGQLVSLGGAAYVVGRQLSLHPGEVLGSLGSFAAGSAAGLLGWVVANLWVPAGVPMIAHAGAGVLASGVLFLVLQRVGRPPLNVDDVHLLVGAMPRALRRPLTPTMAFLGLAA